MLIRRSLADGEHAYFTTWCPQGTPVETLVRVEGTRWRVEEGFETTQNELGLDHNESRSWHGWHRHVSLVMLAYAVMTTFRYGTETRAPSYSSLIYHRVVHAPPGTPSRCKAFTPQI